MPKPDHQSHMARAWLHIHAALGRTWKQGVQLLRVDWPVYPRRAEHNTVAERENRRWAEIVRQNAFQSRWPRPTRGSPSKASPPVRSKAMMSPEASDFAWIFVVKPPRERPSACPSSPLLLRPPTHARARRSSRTSE